jgi:drug/metabolite transporter (DMT)-like permease
MPLVTVVGAALLLGETVEPLFVVGSAFVLVGVYVGISVGRPSWLPGRVPAAAPATVGASAAEPGGVAAVAASGSLSDVDCRPPGC